VLSNILSGSKKTVLLFLSPEYLSIIEKSVLPCGAVDLFIHIFRGLKKFFMVETLGVRFEYLILLREGP